MKTEFFFYLFCLVGLLQGCSHPVFQKKDSDAYVYEALLHSKLWVHVTSLAKKPYFMIERETSVHFEVQVGDSLPERYDGWGTLRVSKRDGRVSRMDYDPKGEIIWVDDAVEKKLQL